MSGWRREGIKNVPPIFMFIKSIILHWHNGGGPMLKGREEKDIRFGAKLGGIDANGKRGMRETD
jgi:hypothetical protein